MSAEETSTVKEWAFQMNECLHSVHDTPIQSEMENWKNRSIYKVPKCVANLNPEAYEPQVVSFGPYHHGQPHLLPMEEHKHRALRQFLKRCDMLVDPFIVALDTVASDLMASYCPLDHDKWNKDNFVKMMLLDGCFIMEVLRNKAETANDYSPDDPIFSAHGKLYIMPYLKRDMLMLENQVPMRVLDELLSVETNGKQNEEFINKLIVKFCSPGMRITRMGKCLHLLDVFRKSLLQDVHRSKQLKWRKRHESKEEIIRSATELYEAGIEFKRSMTGSLKDIQFRDGRLTLPAIVVDDSTKYMFLNLIAYERFHVGVGSDITSYIFFMNNIINSQRDVALLHSKGIIQNAIGSDKAVAKLFNSLSEDVKLDPESALDEVQKKVTDYCNKKPWNKCRSYLFLI